MTGTDPVASARDSAARARKAIDADDTELATAEALPGIIHAALAVSGSIRNHAEAVNRLAAAIEKHGTRR